MLTWDVDVRLAHFRWAISGNEADAVHDASSNANWVNFSINGTASLNTLLKLIHRGILDFEEVTHWCGKLAWARGLFCSSSKFRVSVCIEWAWVLPLCQVGEVVVLLWLIDVTINSSEHRCMLHRRVLGLKAHLVHVEWIALPLSAVISHLLHRGERSLHDSTLGREAGLCLIERVYSVLSLFLDIFDQVTASVA